MSEPVSALNKAAFDGLAHVSEAGLQGMITLRGNLSDATLQKAVKDVTGADMPAIRRADVTGGKGVAWMSPDELLVLCPYAEAEQTTARLTAALGDSHALAVNVSDARAMFRVTGPHLREVIAKIAPVDMDPAAFKPGDFRRTRFAQIAAAFWMQDDQTVNIVCFRSTAPYMMDLLKNAASPGSAVGFF